MSTTEERRRNLRRARIRYHGLQILFVVAVMVVVLWVLGNLGWT